MKGPLFPLSLTLSHRGGETPGAGLYVPPPMMGGGQDEGDVKGKFLFEMRIAKKGPPGLNVKTQHTDPVALSKKIAYSAPAFALAVVGIPVYVYIPKFYTDVVGINIAVLGTLLFSVRIFDALTDPVIGYLSDRSQTRFGWEIDLEGMFARGDRVIVCRFAVRETAVAHLPVDRDRRVWTSLGNVHCPDGGRGLRQ